MSAQPEVEYKVAPIELFFDLIFVFAITQLSHYLAEHMSWRTAIEAGVMLVTVMTVWSYTSWVATMIPVYKTTTSIMILSVAIVGLLMNASISSAFQDASWSFVIPLLLIQFGRTGWTIANAPNQAYKEHFIRVMLWLIIATPLWIAGALSNPDLRLYFWLAAAIFELIGGQLAHPIPGKRLHSQELPFNADHMLERYNLLLIIALGESVLMTGISIAQSPMDPMTIVTGVFAMMISISLWALTFGSAQHHTEEHIKHTTDPVRVSRYSMNIVSTMVACLIILAVASEKIIHHPTGHSNIVYSLMLSCSPAIFLIMQSVYLKFILNVNSHQHWIGGIIVALSGLLSFFLAPYVLICMVSTILATLAIYDRIKMNKLA